MTIATPLTRLLGVDHPILLAPMDIVAGSNLVTAVSRAGGFGILGGGYGERVWLEQEIAKLRGLSAPFGVGFITWSLAKRPELLDVALAVQPSAIMLSFGDPAPFAPRIKSAGARLICQVQDEAMARQALDAGADVLIAQARKRVAMALRAPPSISSRRSLIWRRGRYRLWPLAALPMGAGWPP